MLVNDIFKLIKAQKLETVKRDLKKMSKKEKKLVISKIIYYSAKRSKIIFKHFVDIIDINSMDQEKYSATDYAIIENDLETLKYLINEGAVINLNKIYFLKINIDILKYLKELNLELKNKIDFNKIKKEHALKIAINEESIEDIKYLIKTFNIDMDKIEIGGTGSIFLGNTPIIHSIIYKKSKSLKYLLEIGLKTDQTDQYGWSPIHYAAQRRSIEILKILLKANVDLNQSSENGRSVLCCAIRNSNLKVAQFLIDNGADLNIDFELMKEDRMKPKLKIIKFLFKYGFKIEEHLDYSMYRAIEEGYIDTIDFFIDKFNIDINNYNNESLLKIAIKYEKIDVIKYLINIGANFNNSLEYATQITNNIAIITYLESITNSVF